MIDTPKMKSQYNKCHICTRRTKTKLIICPICNKDPYLIEEFRNSLAIKNKNSLLIKTYSNDYAQLKGPNTQKFWDDKFYMEKSYHQLDSMTKDKINYIISKLPKNTSKILDLGIGQGYLEQRLKTQNIKHNFSAIDISKKSIERAKKTYAGVFIVDNILNMKAHFKKSTFDVIVAIEVIEHIKPHKIFDFYKGCSYLLKRGGMLIISTPLNEGLGINKPNPSSHVRMYNPSVLAFEFEFSNFKVINVKTFTAFNNYYILKKLLYKFVKLRWKENNIVIVAQKK